MLPNELELRAVIRQLHDLPFPSSETSNEDVGELHAELVEFDGYVNGLLRQVLRGETPSHPLEHDPELRSKLECARDCASTHERSKITDFLAYFDLLEHAIDVARRTRG